MLIHGADAQLGVSRCNKKLWSTDCSRVDSANLDSLALELSSLPHNKTSCHQLLCLVSGLIFDVLSTASAWPDSVLLLVCLMISCLWLSPLQWRNRRYMYRHDTVVQLAFSLCTTVTVYSVTNLRLQVTVVQKCST